jgi:hypothetical protein
MFARLNDDTAADAGAAACRPPVAENVRPAVPETATDVPPPAGQTPDDPSGRARETGGADTGRADAGRSGKAGSPAKEASAETAAGTETPVANTEVKIAAIAATPETCAAHGRLQLRRSRQRKSRRSKAVSPRP